MSYTQGLFNDLMLASLVVSVVGGLAAAVAGGVWLGLSTLSSLLGRKEGRKRE